MAVNARTEEFQHIEVFDKPALFTNGRIARDTVPEGWYCYDIRGSDDDPGELCYMEENVVVNHAGSVLMPEKLAMPKSGRLDVRDELGFLDEGNMTLCEFCEAHQLPYPAENMKFHIRPARPEEAGLFYTPHPEEDKRLGTGTQRPSRRTMIRRPWKMSLSCSPQKICRMQNNCSLRTRLDQAGAHTVFQMRM